MVKGAMSAMTKKLFKGRYGVTLQFENCEVVKTVADVDKMSVTDGEPGLPYGSILEFRGKFPYIPRLMKRDITAVIIDGAAYYVQYAEHTQELGAENDNQKIEIVGDQVRISL